MWKFLTRCRFAGCAPLPRLPNAGCARLPRSVGAMMALQLFGVMVVASLSGCAGTNPPSDADIVIYGGTPPGIMAALAAANTSSAAGRRLKIALLVVAGTPLGGMTTGGLADVDTGDRAICGGLAREFFWRVGEVYTGRRQFMPKGQECKISLRVFEQMLAEVSDQVQIYRGVSSLRVERDAARVSGLSVVAAGGEDSRLSFGSSRAMFIDASYEGDLLRLSGASWTLGRESKAAYGEPHAGVQAWPFPGSDPGQIFPPALNYTIDPFGANGKLLPFVNGRGLDIAGSGDRKIMAYNFRVCLTNNASNRVPLPQPPHYNETQYELLARYLSVDPGRHALYIQKCPGGHRQPGCGMFIWGKLHLPNTDTGKLDLNTLGPFSTNMVGASWAWPLANESRRAAIYQQHKDYLQGLLWFLRTSTSVPAGMRHEMQEYGLCGDEFASTGHWPPQLYVRESVRMVNDYVLREGKAGAPLSVLQGANASGALGASVGIGNWVRAKRLSLFN
jgi:hypothetical protein